MEPAGQARLAMAGVTAREAEVLAVIGGRLTNQEIAGHLFISVRTVESHVSALLRKLALPGRSALIELARQIAAEPALPAPPTSFVGREEELAQLRGLLTASPLICLTGPGGCGKSRLALEAARGWAGETRIARLAAVSVADVSAVIAAALGIGYEAADLATAARVALAGRSMLLIADDCDHVVGAAAEQLTALVRAVPGLRVVATTRQPLGVSEERVLAVPPLACPVGSGTGAVRESAAGRLFLDRARAASPQFHLGEAMAPHVADICRRLDGLPLAIELAATRVRTLDVATLADTLTGHVRLTWAATGEPAVAERLLCCLARLIEMQPSRRGIEVICAVAGSDDDCWSSEALALASLAATYLDLRTADQLAARSAARAVSDRDQAYARLSAGWVLAYRQEQAEALAYLDPVIGYARGAAESWLEACAWQARGQAREREADAFSDWQEAVTRFVAAGDMMHASNVRYMLAYRAVEAGERLAEVPVWLRECESFAASRGYWHELAHIHNVRAVYERMQGRLDTARDLLDSALTVFRQAGDFRCTTRALIELAEHYRPGDPAAAADLLLRGLEMAMLAGGGLLRARVLVSLITAAATAGDLPLAARALGVLDALGRLQAPAVPADLAKDLQAPAFNSYVEEAGSAGST
jgi:DNA-binding CsgD family transcriptional regulator